MIAGLAVGAIAGLLVLITLEGVQALLWGSYAEFALGLPRGDLKLGQMATVYLTFGAPVAVVLGIAIGFPLWKRADRKLMRSRYDAAHQGALVGGAIAIISLALLIASGTKTYLDADSGYSSYSYGILLIDDGLPTAAGWMFQLINVVKFLVAGAGGGLAAREVAHSFMTRAARPEDMLPFLDRAKREPPAPGDEI